MTFEPLSRYAYLPSLSMRLEVREQARGMGMKMLRAMWAGGIHDWVGNGFARYTVDERWVVPHFEKMLLVRPKPLQS